MTALPETQIWPDSYPLPLLATYVNNIDKGMLRSVMEGGPARQRQLFTQVSSSYKATFILTNDQFDVFRGFFKWTLLEGALPFCINLRLGNSLEDPDLLTNETARFTGPYTAKTDSTTHWEVSGILEVLNPTILCQDLTELFITGNSVLSLEELAALLLALEVIQANLPYTIP